MSQASTDDVFGLGGTAGISGSNECATVAAKFVHPDNPHFVAKHLKTRGNELVRILFLFPTLVLPLTFCFSSSYIVFGL